MGNKCGKNCSLGGYRTTAKEPTQEQQAKLRLLTEGVLQKVEGRGALVEAKRARDPGYQKEELYKAATPAPTSLLERLLLCCPSWDPEAGRGARLQEDVVSSNVDSPLPTPGPGDFHIVSGAGYAAASAALDPGPPVDALPAAFLGPPRAGSPHVVLGPQARQGHLAEAAGDSMLPYASSWYARRAPSSLYGPGSPVAQPEAGRADGEVEQAPGSVADQSAATAGVATAAGAEVAAASSTSGAPGPAGAATYAGRRGYPKAGSGGGGEGLGDGSTVTNEALEKLAQHSELNRDFKARYELGKRLNAGAQGVTYLATAKYSGVKVVVKTPNNPSDVSDFTMLILKKHPNIVRVYELFEGPVESFIVMEYCAGGDLFHAIEQLRTPTQNWCASVFRQILWGVRYLHDFFKESHNDIKPENIFLDHKPSGPSDVPRAMIGDFGCLAPVDRGRRGGDPRYRAPETVDLAQFGRATDVWSLGVTLYEVVSGGLLIYIDEPNMSSWEKFRSTELWDRLQRSLQRGLPVPLDKLGGGEGLDQRQLKDLLGGLLEINPKRRMSAERALQEPWLLLGLSSKPVPFEPTVATSLLRRAKHHVLDLALLNVVGGQLQGESVRYYQEIWGRYDLDANGQMQLEEFGRMLQDMGFDKPAGMALPLKFMSLGVGTSAQEQRPSVEDLFALVDRNASGTVDFSEFVAMMFDPGQLSDLDRTAYLKQAFLSLAGEDGKISAEELTGLFYGSGDLQAEGRQVVDDLFRLMDTDLNGFIEYPEFASYVDRL